MPIALRAVCWAAVSTPDQANEDHVSIPLQLSQGRGVCEARVWPVVAEIAVRGHSRAYDWLDELTADCPEYAQLIRMVRNEEMDVIVARDYDRLWRTDALRAQVTAICRQHSVQVFSINQPVEPIPKELLAQSNGDSRLIMEALSGVISQMENETRRRRTRLGMEGRIARGLHASSAATPYGYRAVAPDQPLAIDETQAGWVRWIFAQRLAGEGFVAIANALNDQGIPTATGRSPWHPNVVRQILTNPYYAGHVFWGEAYNEHGLHEPLITPEQWRRIQDINTLRANRRYTTNRLFSGLCRCGFCGASMVYQHSQWTDQRGRRRERLRLQCCDYCRSGGRLCRSNTIPERRLRPVVLEAVTQILADPDLFVAAREEQQDTDASRRQLQRLDAEISQLDSAWKRWSDLFERGGIAADELLDHRQRILGNRGRLQHQRDALSSDLDRAAGARQTVERLSHLLDVLPDLPDDELRTIYQQLIRHIIITKKEYVAILWW